MEKKGYLACKNRANGGAVRLGYSFPSNRKTEKKFRKSLIFNSLLFFGFFSVSFRWLFGAEKPLRNNAFKHFQAGGWVKGRVLSKG
jgi:hypothetical protein